MTNFNVFTTTLKSTIFKQITTLLLVFTLVFGFYTEGSSQCPCTNCGCTDSLELVKLYNATNGANWTKKWILTDSLKNWYGVTLENGRVKTLILVNNQLAGTIPNFNLPNLQTLNIGNNQLIGSVPNFNLPQLKDLSLYFNQLIGQIPNFNLPNLEFLNLSGNQLSGIVPNFNLTNLKKIAITNNHLIGLIPNLILPNLEQFHLNNNELSGTIPNFNLPKLEYINFEFNQLSGSIPNFTLPNLKLLYLSGNQLSGSIPNFSLPKLVQLLLIQNQLSGRIPNFTLPNLEFLWLAHNQLREQVPSFNLPMLYTLWLNNNQLVGCIPKEIKFNCPMISAGGGEIRNNPNLSTQSWANYWNNSEGACPPTAVENTQENNGRLYPNPVHDFLFIEGFEKASKVLIYNVLGSLVLNKNADEKGIDISYLSNGIYTVLIMSGERSAARLFMKN